MVDFFQISPVSLPPVAVIVGFFFYLPPFLRLLSLAGQVALALVVPNRFHLRIMEAQWTMLGWIMDSNGGTEPSQGGAEAPELEMSVTAKGLDIYDNVIFSFFFQFFYGGLNTFRTHCKQVQ